MQVGRGEAARGEPHRVAALAVGSGESGVVEGDPIDTGRRRGELGLDASEARNCLGDRRRPAVRLGGFVVEHGDHPVETGVVVGRGVAEAARACGSGVGITGAGEGMGRLAECITELGSPLGEGGSDDPQQRAHALDALAHAVDALLARTRGAQRVPRALEVVMDEPPKGLGDVFLRVDAMGHAIPSTPPAAAPRSAARGRLTMLFRDYGLSQRERP